MGLKTKDAGMRVRVERGLRQQFVRACRSSGTPAAQVLRTFTRDYIVRRQSGQRDLFAQQKAEHSQ